MTHSGQDRRVLARTGGHWRSSLATAATVARLVGDAHDRYSTLDGGAVADCIPFLARSDCPVSGRRWFAGALAFLVPRWASEHLLLSLCTGRRRAR